MSPTWIQRYCGKGRIQLVGNPHGSCPEGWWHHVVVWRLYCYCNTQFNIPQYPISLPDYVFVKLQRSKRFNKLDSMNAHQKLPLEPDSQRFVTINTHCGLYWYKRLPFGIASFPAIFQQTSFFKVLSMLQPFYMTFWSWDRMMNSTFRIWTLFSFA